MRAKAYTDGACSGNPGPGGWAALILADEAKFVASGNEENTTNNRMELFAAIKAIEKFAYVCLHYNSKYTKLDVYSDSAYVVNAVNNKWIKKWKFNNWKTVRNEDVKNRDLWERLDRLLVLYKVEFIKVKGHSGHTHNEYVNDLAQQEVTNIK